MAAAARTIILRSSDGEEFEVDEATGMESQTIKFMIDDGCADNVIPIVNIASGILAMVIEYSKKHAEARTASASDFDADKLKEWDTEFAKVDKNTLFELIHAADYLEIKGLLDLTARKIADIMKGKSVEEMRKIFNIVNDFTPEEEEEIRNENPWAFE